ncbi:MAG: MoaD/ThiS family protein [Pirellulaceae bacterium]
MRINVYYWNQLRSVRGVADEQFDFDGEPTVADLLQRVAQHEDTKPMIFDSAANISPWLLIDRGGVMIRDLTVALADGDEIRLSMPISGG